MRFPSSTPAEQGVDARGLLALVDALEAAPGIEPHGIVVHRHGQRVAEGYWAPHAADLRRHVYSLSKTFTGTALALQLGEGRLGLDDLVADHLPELFVDAAPITRRMRIRHIASMSSGHDREMLVDAVQADRENPLRGFFSLAPSHEPGTHFAYNQPPVFALAAVLQRLARSTLTDYLRPRLLEPLGLPQLAWQQYPRGVDLGFSGAHTTLDSVARLGQLYLDDGMWAGRRILPEGWVAQASSPQIANPQESEMDWRQGYGFQLWMSRHGYRGDGAFGQFMIVLPEEDAVVAIFSATTRLQAVLDAVWTHLLPAMAPDATGSRSADEALAERLTGLRLPTARERVGGEPVGPQPRVRLVPAGPQEFGAIAPAAVRLDGSDVVLEEPDGEVRVRIADEWTAATDGPTAGAVAASAARLGDRVVVDVAFLETPHRLHLTCDPAAGTFRSDWGTAPLGGAGVGDRLTDLRVPAHAR